MNQKKKEERKTKLQLPQVIFEDNALLVISKPSGWVTNDSQTTIDRPTIQGWIKKTQKFKIANSQEFRSGIVHRLDKETSGVLLIAKDEKTFEFLQSQFKDRKVQKTYTALVHGKTENEKGTIQAPVGRLPWNRERFGILPGGRSSETLYTTKAYYVKDTEYYSLLELYPKTGRTHQIRIHMKYIHHPIVSDSFYAGRKTSRKDCLWCPRLFLHASQASIIHPVSGKKVNFSSDLPDDLKSALSSLHAS